MLNLEAIDEIIERFERSAEFQRTHGDLMGCQEFKQIAEWLKELKAYKEQESCEDAISREELLKSQTVIIDDDGLAHKVVHIGRICAAPSVIPKQKTGKWNILGYDDPSDVKLYRCSECHMKITLKFNYCPNCGAKMEGED